MELKHAKKIRIIAYTSAAAFFLASSIFSVPNVLVDQENYSFANRVARKVFPQGWGFFTKSGREPIVTPYHYDSNSAPESIAAFPVGAPKYDLGFDRRGRAQGVEIGRILIKLPDLWQDCSTRESESCVQSAVETEPISVVNDRLRPTICGKTILLENEPILFSFRKFNERKRNAKRFMHIDVECENDVN